MFCTQCGALREADDLYCGACGARMRPAAAPATSPPAARAPIPHPPSHEPEQASPLEEAPFERPERPVVITLVAIGQFVAMAVYILIVTTVTLAALNDATAADAGEVAVILGAGLTLAGVSLVCGIGLLRLRPFGRTMQLVMSWIGLLLIPVGTVIGILLLVYLNKPEIKALFQEQAEPGMATPIRA